MKKLKSLTCLLAIVLLSACSGKPSATFSSSEIVSSSVPSSEVEPQSSSSEISSEASSESESSSEPSISSESSPITSSEESSSVESSSSSEESTSSEVSSSEISSSSSLEETSHYDGYYDSLVSWENGEDLKNQLHAIIRNGYTPISYAKSSGANYATNIDADHSKFDFEYLDGVYSKDHIAKTDTNKGWQREHAFCATLMCGSGTGDAVKFLGRATDFHNLFASSTNGNTARGNKNYGYADSNGSNYTDRTTDNGIDGYSYDVTNFEPGDNDKGRLARAIFYMATMYKDDEQDTVNNKLMKGLTIVENPVIYDKDNPTYSIGNLSALLSWNTNFTVDYLEMQHNVSVYKNTDNPDGKAQGNRNPYVDYPELVDYVYGSKKDQPGKLADLLPSESYLHSDEKILSHYAIKQAQREYGYGSQMDTADYEVVAVYTDYSYEKVEEGLTHSLTDHVFDERDGGSIRAYIDTPKNRLSYDISLVVLMAACKTGELSLNTTGINKKTPDVDQEVTYGDYKFTFNFSTNYAQVADKGVTITNIGTGGITVGSGNTSITKLVITSVDSYTIDEAYIKALRGNASSSYNLTIKVGDKVLLESTRVDQADATIFGKRLKTPLTGQISYIFTGSTSIKINSIAFNYIIA